MVLRWIATGLLMCMLASCGSRALERPPLSEEKMLDVLIDIHLLEAQQQQVQPFEKGRVISTIAGYEKIFRKHGITAEEFHDSFTWYRNHPKQMDEMYQRMIEEVTRRESELSTQAIRERAANPDTTRRAKAASAINEW